VQYKKTSDENKQIFELGDCLLIQHQILETNIIRIHKEIDLNTLNPKNDQQLIQYQILKTNITRTV
ncbi:unnamed protein product, partial [Pocillopora meandrina]